MEIENSPSKLIFGVKHDPASLGIIIRQMPSSRTLVQIHPRLGGMPMKIGKGFRIRPTPSESFGPKPNALRIGRQNEHPTECLMHGPSIGIGQVKGTEPRTVPPTHACSHGLGVRPTCQYRWRESQRKVDPYLHPLRRKRGVVFRTRFQALQDRRKAGTDPIIRKELHDLGIP